MVVVQSVERRHTTRVGCVQIPVAPRVRILSCFRCRQSILTGHRTFFLPMKWDESRWLPSSFLFPIPDIINCKKLYLKCEKISPKRSQEWPELKKNCGVTLFHWTEGTQIIFWLNKVVFFFHFPGKTTSEFVQFDRSPKTNILQWRHFELYDILTVMRQYQHNLKWPTLRGAGTPKSCSVPLQQMVVGSKLGKCSWVNKCIGPEICELHYYRFQCF